MVGCVQRNDLVSYEACGKAQLGALQSDQGSTMVTLAQHVSFHLWRAGSIGLDGIGWAVVCECVCVCEVVKCVHARAHM